MLTSTAATRRREHARRIWEAGVAAVRAATCLPAALRAQDLTWREYEQVLLLGGGKAGASMAEAAELGLIELGVDQKRVTGWLNVPNDTVRPLRRVHLHPARPIGMNEPTSEAVAGTEEILRLAMAAPPMTLMICLISGGGSALLCAPSSGVTLADKQAVARRMSGAGASIQQMNCVRKHLSSIKGGNLARLFLSEPNPGRRLLTLVISDVMGDPLDVIASGPTVPDPTTFGEAQGILNDLGLSDQVPAAVRIALEEGRLGHRPETWKDTDARATAQVIANNHAARSAAIRAAEDLGYAVIDQGELRGDTLLAAERMAAEIANLPGRGSRRCLISGGETTMVLPASPGKGGRNQTFALALGQALWKQGRRGFTVLCGGTDGEDGPTDAAGGVTDSETFATAAALGLSANEALRRCDAYSFLAAAESLLVSGLTQTNVMDLRLVLLEDEPRPEARGLTV